MRKIKKLVPRSTKEGWCLQKFHDLLHLVFDIFEYEAPGNFDAGPGEQNLIKFAKDPAKTAQK